MDEAPAGGNCHTYVTVQLCCACTCANLAGEETSLTAAGRSKRVQAKFHKALDIAPANAQRKWGEIQALKGKRGIQQIKKKFVLTWVGNPDWTEAYFSQELNLVEGRKDEMRGVWITTGRLAVLLGEDDAKRAVEEKWYSMRTNSKNSKVEIFYTEESVAASKERRVAKNIKGGTKLSVEDGKSMMADGMVQSWADAMGSKGIDNLTDVGFEVALPQPGASSSEGLPALVNAEPEAVVLGCGRSGKRKQGQTGQQREETEPPAKKKSPADKKVEKKRLQEEAKLEKEKAAEEERVKKEQVFAYPHARI